MSLRDSSGFAHAEHSGRVESRFRSGAGGARTPVPRCLRPRRGLLCASEHLAPTGVSPQSAHDGAWAPHPVAPARAPRSAALWCLCLDALEPQAVSLADALGGSARRCSARGAYAMALVGCGHTCTRVADGDRVDVARRAPATACGRAALLCGEWHGCRAAGLDQRLGRPWNGAVGADAAGAYQPYPRPSITAGGSNMIFKSSNAERWLMYSRS